MKFTEFKFKDYIQEALRDLNFVEATPVQEKLIPVVLSGRDLVGESKTGSGKTHTFLLPIFQMLDEEADSVQAVITAPSRELAAQIYQAARQLASFSERGDSGGQLCRWDRQGSSDWKVRVQSASYRHRNAWSDL